MSGYLFYCDHQTELECLQRGLLGAPQMNAMWAAAIREGDTLILYNFQTGDVFGPLVAASGMDCFEPAAWGGKFPVQVRFRAGQIFKSNIAQARAALLGSKSAKPKHILPDSLVIEVATWLQTSGEPVSI